MTFEEVLAQVLDPLQRQGRVSSRALGRRFDLDDDDHKDLKAETCWLNASKGHRHEPRSHNGRSAIDVRPIHPFESGQWDEPAYLPQDDRDGEWKPDGGLPSPPRSGARWPG